MALLAGLCLMPVVSASAQVPAKTLVRAIGGAPDTLDPQRADLTLEITVISDLLEGLLAPDGKGGARPALAESWTVSPDERTYTFRLRPDAQWSDGSLVTADDFVFSWRRLADPKTAGPFAFFTWTVVNGEAIAKGAIQDVSRLGVSALDAHTFQVELVRPTAYFLSMLQHPALAAVQKASVLAWGDAFTQPGHYVASGAYVLAENAPGDHLTLVRNPHYYDRAKVRVDRVTDLPMEDRAAETRLFQAGRLSVTYDLPIPQVAWARDTLKGAYVAGPLFDTYFLAFNLRNEPWKSSPQLREALTLAIDRDRLAALLGEEQPAYSFVPPLAPGTGVAAYEPGWPAWRGLAQVQRVARARVLLAEAGFGPGGHSLPAVDLLYAAGGNSAPVMVAVAAMWREALGLEVRLEAREFRTVTAQARDKTFKDLVFTSWLGDYPDANSFLALLRADAGPENNSGYRNPLFDALMEEANGESDATRRADLMRRAERLMLDDTPIIPLFHKGVHRLVSPRIAGWTPNMLDLIPSRFLDLAP
ncbi:MAG: peptide ABC transporter substrate-binding protein [Azospirillaceae bacterium]|nr:peptide ABC transporter substrate-binding protein [Azospirillaceae bacterium]